MSVYLESGRRLGREINNEGELTRRFFKWAHSSFDSFNEALEIAARKVSGGSGYSIINGEKVFTGSTFCEDATIAYGLAIKKKFPKVQDMEYVDLFAKNLGWHTLLKFSIEGRDYFLDATYGQIIEERNKLVLEKFEDIKKFYTLRRVSGIDILIAGLQYKNSIFLSGKILLAPFKARNRGGGSTFRVNGKYMKIERYLRDAIISGAS